MAWDPEQYERFARERGRPFDDLVGRIGSVSPRRVVDLGCGPGTATASLAQRWPDAVVEGLDSSPEMIAAAASVPGVSFRVADIATWSPPGDADVIVSNAALQWVPGHLDLLAGWADAVPRGGWLAWQVPGNFRSPSHLLLRHLTESPRWADRLAGVLWHHDEVAEPEAYARLLLAAGLHADVWETTYQHVLSGADPVLEWLRGTGLRPVLAALPPADADEFVREFAALLREAYPASDGVTVFPFRRIFAIGHRD